MSWEFPNGLIIVVLQYKAHEPIASSFFSSLSLDVFVFFIHFCFHCWDYLRWLKSTLICLRTIKSGYLIIPEFQRVANFDFELSVRSIRKSWLWIWRWLSDWSLHWFAYTIQLLSMFNAMKSKFKSHQYHFKYVSCIRWCANFWNRKREAENRRHNYSSKWERNLVWHRATC